MGTVNACRTVGRLISASKPKLGFCNLSRVVKRHPSAYCSSGLPQQLQSTSPRSSFFFQRLQGPIAMVQSLMPMHSATAAASFVSKLCNDEACLEGRYTYYVSPI